MRKGEKKDFVIIMNCSTNPYDNVQFGVSVMGQYKEILNTQWSKYNGNYIDDTPQSCHAVRLLINNRPYMIQVNVPSLGAIVLEVEHGE